MWFCETDEVSPVVGVLGELATAGELGHHTSSSWDPVGEEDEEWPCRPAAS